MFLGPSAILPPIQGRPKSQGIGHFGQGKHLTVMFPSVSVTSTNFRKQFLGSLLIFDWLVEACGPGILSD